MYMHKMKIPGGVVFYTTELSSAQAIA